MAWSGDNTHLHRQVAGVAGCFLSLPAISERASVQRNRADVGLHELTECRFSSGTILNSNDLNEPKLGKPEQHLTYAFSFLVLRILNSFFFQLAPLSLYLKFREVSYS